jgi:hypothetical protein
VPLRASKECQKARQRIGRSLHLDASEEVPRIEGRTRKTDSPIFSGFFQADRTNVPSICRQYPVFISKNAESKLTGLKPIPSSRFSMS